MLRLIEIAQSGDVLVGMAEVKGGNGFGRAVADTLIQCSGFLVLRGAFGLAQLGKRASPVGPAFYGAVQVPNCCQPVARPAASCA